MGDKSISDDDEDNEFTCELQTFPNRDPDEVALDWSVSGISVASGYDPERYYTELSSNWNSPEKSVRGAKHYQEYQPSGDGTSSASLELKKLAGSVKDLQLNLAGISQMSGSPRREKFDNMADTETSKTRSVDVTPPVRDPGPGDGTVIKNTSARFTTRSQVENSDGKSKLDQMKTTLKELEEARRKYNVSKIPRRSLVFGEQNSSSVPTSQNSTKTSQMSASSRESETSSEVVSKFGSSQSSKSEMDTDKTIVENTQFNAQNSPGNLRQKSSNNSDELIRKLNQELQYKKLLEEQIEKLKQQVHGQENELLQLKDLDAKKEKLMLDLKSKCAELGKNWSEELQKSRNEVARLKAENQAAKQQFYVCEEELSKALQLASDFKLKIDEEESMKQDILTELLSERTTKANKLLLEQGRNKELMETNRSLMDQLDRVKMEQMSWEKKQETLQENLFNIQKNFTAERTRYQKEIAESQSKAKILEDKVRSLENELKTTQTAMHAFYGSQMEAIMSEKVATLQENVADWEKSLAAEKLRDIEQLKQQHREQLESLSKEWQDKMSDQKNHVEHLEASLNAARREADALREQVQLHERRRNSSTPMTAAPLALTTTATTSHEFNMDSAWASLLAQQNFPRFHNNLRTSDDVPDVSSNRAKLQSPITTTTDEEEELRSRLSSRQNRPKQRPKSSTQGSMVLNNLREDKMSSHDHPVTSYDPKRSLSAAASGPESRYRRRSGNRESSHDETGSIMSVSEKKDIVQGFIRQYLEDHPESVLDASFLSGLHEMACQLVQESFHFDETNDQAGYKMTMQRSTQVTSSASHYQTRVTNHAPVSLPPNLQKSTTTSSAPAISYVPNNLPRDVRSVTSEEDQTKKKTNRKPIWK